MDKKPKISNDCEEGVDISAYEDSLGGYFKYIIEHMPGHVYWKDRNGVYLGSNKSQAKNLGFDSASDLIGKTDFDLPWPEGSAEEFRKNDLHVMETGESCSAEEISFINGKEVSVHSEKIPLRDKNGGIVGVMGVSVDITDRKKLEEALIKAKSSRIKSEFIANMSHDLRTPITGILGMLEELGELAKDIAEKPDRAKEIAHSMMEYVNIGRSSTNELLNLFNDILDTIKLDLGKVKMDKGCFSPVEKINAISNLLRATAEDKSLKLIQNIDPAVPKYLLGSKHYLDRILVNLISNALKFTEKGGVEIKAEVVSEGPTQLGDEVTLRVSVIDTGIGIPKDKQEAIFEHFSRVNPSYEGVYKGNGLGLYSVKQYVEGMKGIIRLDSEVGKGSTFTVELPFVVSDHADTEKADKPLPPLPRESNAVKKVESHSWEVAAETANEAYVLVVEDNFAAAMSIKGTLKRQGCRVDHAKTGQEAIDLAKAHHYDIIFMDIGLPGISGLDATKAIRGFSAVPIIAVTGHVDKAGVCIDAGMQELLAKPATPSSLEAMLNRHVHSKDDEANKLNDGQTIIDWPCSVRMHEGDPEITKEILDMINEEITQSEKIIDTAYEQQNIKRIRDELHKMRGGVCYLRLPQLERALKDFHLTVKENPIVPEDMMHEYQNLKRSIKAFKGAYETGDYLTIDQD